jgi:hypothetical protein
MPHPQEVLASSDVLEFLRIGGLAPEVRTLLRQQFPHSPGFSGKALPPSRFP